MGFKQKAISFCLIGLSCTLAWGEPYVVSANGALAVKGTQIINAKGKAVAFAGPSFFWSNSGWGAEGFFNHDTVAWAKRTWQASMVRAVVGVEGPGGYLAAPLENKNRAFAVIDAAIAEDMYVLVDWHDHHAHQGTAPPAQPTPRPQPRPGLGGRLGRRHGDGSIRHCFSASASD